MYNMILFCVFDMIFTSKSTIFHFCRDESSWVEPVLSNDQCVLLKDTRIDANETRTHNPLSQALHHCDWATVFLTYNMVTSYDEAYMYMYLGVLHVFLK